MYIDNIKIYNMKETNKGFLGKIGFIRKMRWKRFIKKIIKNRNNEGFPLKENDLR